MLATDSPLALALQIVSATFGLAGQALINRRHANGFWCWILANAASITLSAGVGLWVLAVLHVVYLALSIAGLRRWTAETARAGPPGKGGCPGARCAADKNRRCTG
jgi:nicotinamide riboside transporter PnuC